MRIQELRDREVINVCDCKRLGYVCDVDFDAGSGLVRALIIPGPCRICGLIGHDGEYIIPYGCVRRIGEEIILVEIREEECLRK